MFRKKVFWICVIILTISVVFVALASNFHSEIVIQQPRHIDGNSVEDGIDFPKISFRSCSISQEDISGPTDIQETTGSTVRLSQEQISQGKVLLIIESVNNEIQSYAERNRFFTTKSEIFYTRAWVVSTTEAQRLDQYDIGEILPARLVGKRIASLMYRELKDFKDCSKGFISDGFDNSVITIRKWYPLPENIILSDK